MAPPHVRKGSSARALPGNDGGDWMSLRGLVVAAVCLALTAPASAKPFPPQCKHTSGSSDVMYTIMMDAGSSGTRMHVFSFNVNFPKVPVASGGPPPRIELQSSTYQRTQPGLSSFASSPAKVAESLEPMVAQAEKTVPANKIPCTSIALKATAGLRLLPEPKRNALLKQVETLFNRHPFHPNDPSSVIMDGPHEGYYSWLMIVFALKRNLESNNIAALDLGGASTQLTFMPEEATTLARKDHIHKFSLPGGQKQKDIYSHSYLGGGLLFARTKILRKSKTAKKSRILVSPCVHPNSVSKDGVTWSYMGKDFTVKAASDFNGYAPCYALARDYVTKKMQVFSPKELSESKRNIFAMSGFFYRANDTGLIGPTAVQGAVTVIQYEEAAKKICGAENKQNPYLCVDLCYITALLKDGYRLRNKEKITVIKQIDNSEVSWALGAALAELDLSTS